MPITLRTLAHREAIRALVQRQITDPINGEVLDVRTVVVIDDVDGYPVAVYAPSAWEHVLATAESLGCAPLSLGYTVGKSFNER